MAIAGHHVVQVRLAHERADVRGRHFGDEAPGVVFSRFHQHHAVPREQPRDHEGRGIGLASKIEAYILQDAGFDTVDANLKLGHEIDQREWQDAAEILKLLGVNQLQLLTNNPEKVNKLTDLGFEVERVEHLGAVNAHNEKYLSTKQVRLKHELGI